MNNPLKDVEDKNTWKDFGRQGKYVYDGAREEGASRKEAVDIVRAFVAGMMMGAAQAQKENEEEQE